MKIQPKLSMSTDLLFRPRAQGPGAGLSELPRSQPQTRLPRAPERSNPQAEAPRAPERRRPEREGPQAEPPALPERPQARPEPRPEGPQAGPAALPEGPQAGPTALPEGPRAGPAALPEGPWARPAPAASSDAPEAAIAAAGTVKPAPLSAKDDTERQRRLVQLLKGPNVVTSGLQASASRSKEAQSAASTKLATSPTADAPQEPLFLQQLSASTELIKEAIDSQDPMAMTSVAPSLRPEPQTPVESASRGSVAEPGHAAVGVTLESARSAGKMGSAQGPQGRLAQDATRDLSHGGPSSVDLAFAAPLGLPDARAMATAGDSAPLQPAQVQTQTMQSATETVVAESNPARAPEASPRLPREPASTAPELANAPVERNAQTLALAADRTMDRPAQVTQEARPEPAPQQPTGVLSLPALTALASHRALAVPSLVLPTPPGQPGFAAELSQQLMLWLREGVQQAELQLNPQALGPIQVQLQLEGQQAQVRLLAEQPATREALQQGLAELGRSLAEQGLQLGQADVGDSRPRAREQAERESAADPGPRTRGSAQLAMPLAGAGTLALRPRGLLDLYA